MIDGIDQFPRVLVEKHVLVPRKRFVTDDHARFLRDAGEHAELVGDGRIVADHVGRNVTAREDAVRAEFVHQLELAPGAFDVPGEALGRHTIEVTERLEQIDRQA